MGTYRRIFPRIVVVLAAAAGGGGCLEDVPRDPTGSGTGGGGGTGPTCNSCDYAFCDSTLPVCAGDAQTQYNALITCLDACQGACGAEGHDATNPDDWTDSADACADGKIGTVDASDATSCGLCVYDACNSQVSACE